MNKRQAAETIAVFRFMMTSGLSKMPIDENIMNFIKALDMAMTELNNAHEKELTKGEK